jgi:hypothetical protein
VEIVQIQQVDNKFTRAIVLWLDIIVAGFITEFAVDTAKSYNAAEQEFLKGPRGRYIMLLYTSIKMLLYKNDPNGCQWPPTYSNWLILAIFQFDSFFLVFRSLTSGAILRP